MPRKKGFVQARLNNFKIGAKRLIEHFSPRKRQRIDTTTISNLDNENIEKVRILHFFHINPGLNYDVQVIYVLIRHIN